MGLGLQMGDTYVALEPLHLAIAIYALGVIAGLVAIDARPAPRVGLAAVWPLGPLAFIVTVTMLILVAAVAFPARSLLRR